MSTQDPDPGFELDTEEILRIFEAEVEEGLVEMEETLLVLERNPQDTESLATVFRVMHNIKGNAKSFGFAGLNRFTHRVEEVLDRVRRGELPPDEALVTLLLRSIDAVRILLSDAAAGHQDLRPAELRLLDELSRLETENGPAAESRPEESAERLPSAVPGAVASTLRVDVERLDRLLNLTGEISIAGGRLNQLLHDGDPDRPAILEAQEQLALLFLDLQHVVTRVRMVPVGSAFRQQLRAVRDLGRERGKRVRLELTGEDVEVDTSVIEHLRDPLTHLVRNAVDHGIESPGTRRAAGKPPTGRLTLSAGHEGSAIVIELTDDGAGLDRERILRRARNLGLVDEGTALTEAEADQLIFEPGFSTAEAVTDLSGRGVGLDVVKRNVDALRGSVSVTSHAGRGTTFTLRLPLTLAIIHGFYVGVAGETYVLPMDAVLETLGLPLGRGARRNGHGVINLRGAPLPWVRLRHLLGIRGAPPGRESVVVVEGKDRRRAGLVVDALHGDGQTVIKPLARLFRRLPGISGSAILGTGRVAFILDVATLLRREAQREAGSQDRPLSAPTS